MSFLSNFNILIQILLGPTNLLESNEDMLIYIYLFCQRDLRKRGLDLFLRNSEKCLCENEIFKLALFTIEKE